MATVLYPSGHTLAAENANGFVVAEVSAGIWGRASTWALLLLLIYYALNGISPFVNDPTAARGRHRFQQRGRV